MSLDRFLVLFDRQNTSVETDLKPWLIADNSFTELNNVYPFRGRIRKRFGSRFMGTGWSSSQTEPLFSRLRINLGNTDGAGAFAGIVPGSVFKVGQQFSVGDQIFTVNVLGAPAALLHTGVGTGTYDTTTGALTIAATTLNATPVWFYPAEPVMGFAIYEQGAINNQPTYAFDTQFAYLFSGGFWQRLVIASASIPASTIAPVWHAPNPPSINFFWNSNWDGFTSNQITMFITNFQALIGPGLVTDDAIWAVNASVGWTPLSYAYDDPALPNGNNPSNTQPLTVTRTSTKVAGGTITNYVQSARLVITYKNRLLLLNTIENNGNGATQYDTTNLASRQSTGVTSGGAGNYVTSTNTAFVNRCRYSHNGSPFAQNAWLEPNRVYYPDAAAAATKVIADGGGYIDASTEESIISAEFVKDQLIVYFERSTWAIVYTGNDATPFVWQKINTSLGSESQNSTVPFDKYALTIGNTGVHSCNSANVERIDNKIPDKVFQIIDKTSGVQRVAGIRDYYVEMVYWTFPSDSQPTAQVYPGRVLVYNYNTGGWAFNDDCFTAFGYFEQQDGMTWANQMFTWETANFTWNSGTTSANFRQVIAGNPEGYVVIIDPDNSKNARNLSITDIAIAGNIVTLTIIDHTLLVGQYLAFSDLSGIVFDAERGYSIIATDDTLSTITINTIGSADWTGLYSGGGYARRISILQLETKQWNPYNSSNTPGNNFSISKIDFYVLKTINGEVTVDYFPSSSNVSMLVNSAPGVDTGTGILETRPYDPNIYPMEQFQNRLWHTVYFGVSGDMIQLDMTLSDAQLKNLRIADSDFELHGLILYTQKAGRLQ